MPGFTVLAAGGAVFLAILISYIFSPKHDAREPPLIHPKIPVIGHVLGMLRYGVPYIAQQSRKHQLPAFTLNLLVTKLYIVISPPLVAAVQRSHKVISFDPLLTGFAKRLAGVQGPGLKLLQEKQNGGGGVNQTVTQAMQTALFGPGLDRMNEKMIKNLKSLIDELVENQGAVVDLNQWIRHVITVASTDAVYGPLNPYKSKSIEDAFWAYESNLTILLLDMFPRFTARKPWKARNKVTEALLEYYSEGGHNDSSELTYVRWKAQHDAGVTLADIAKMETSEGVGLLSNTVPSTFWTVFNIFCRPDLLSDIRDELRKAVVMEENDVHIVDLALIREKCPLLISTYQEVLRTASIAAPTRVMYEDVMLNDEYLIKTGGLLFTPAVAIHRQPSAWGDNADAFNPRRFLSQKNTRLSSFMSFGATPWICPGRHFATGEILALSAMLILRCDIVPTAGRWIKPKDQIGAMAASILPPSGEFNVKVQARKEYEGTEWNFKVTPGKGRFGLITG